MRIFTSDWTEYFSKGEKQRRDGFESKACTNYAYNNAIEAKGNYKLKKNLITEENKKWLSESGYFKGGLNFSDRALAEWSNTSKDGNVQRRVINAAEDKGLVPESLWPYPEEADWEEFYQDPPEYVEKQGKEFLDRFELIHEWVRKEVWDTEIKKSPIITFVWAWAQDDDGIYYRPESEDSTNHAIVVYRKSDTFKGKKIWHIQDSYDPFQKRVYDSNIAHGGYIVDIIDKFNFDIMEFIQKHDLKWVQNKETGQFGRIMRGNLYTIESKDRGALILLDAKVRENGIRISEKVWQSLPKKEF